MVSVSEPKTIEKEFIHDGIWRLALVPINNESIPFREAIVVDFYSDLIELYKDSPKEFLDSLWSALWNIGIRRKLDLKRPDASNLVAQAIRSAVKHDVAAILFLGKES